MARSSPSALYPRLIGAMWFDLDEAVRRIHFDGAAVRAAGTFRVWNGSGRLARWLLWWLRMPRAAEAVDTRLVITPQGHGERWQRTFGGRSLVSIQVEGADRLLAERMGIMELRFRLEVADGALDYKLAGVALCVGPVCLSLPQRMSPSVTAREEVGGSPPQAHIRVSVTVPLAGPLIAYEGDIQRKETLP